MLKRRMIRNSVITPDGTHLVSKDNYDFVGHKDANGKTYAIDGGTECPRFIGDFSDCVDTSVYSDDGIIIIRDAFLWGTYGPNGDQDLTYVLLKNLSDNHIENIIRTQNLTDYLLKIFKGEQEFRKSEKLSQD